MRELSVALIYIAMLVFDSAMVSGAIWLVITRDWSAWWILAAVFFCFGSNPKYLIATAFNTEVREP
jgi:hypothetical protein